MQLRPFVLGAVLALGGCALDDTTSHETFAANGGGAIEWVGDTHLRVGETWLPPTITPAAGRDLDVFAQTFPVGAARTVELFWADADYGQIDSVEMTLDADWVGLYGNNSQWRAAIPSDALATDADTHYWIRAEDFEGNVLYDSQSGGNYHVRARRYDVGWIGGLGSYRPINGDYVVGGLFNDEGSTSTGCWNHGVSASSFRARAARVWIPGLTDRGLDDAELAAVRSMVRFEVYTDARDGGWTGIPAQHVRREGNDFLYQFMFATFNPGCVIGLGDGTYSFKLRASTDDGASWFWRGTDNGPSGGDDLLVQYAARCSYFNNPFDCIPTETDLTRALPGGPVQEWHGTTLGATSTFTKELIGGDNPVTVADIQIVGPDADQFWLDVVDVATNEYVDAAGPFEMTDGDELRLVLVHAPTTASPSAVLPHQATVVWTETTNGPPQTRDVTGIHLRGTTAH